MVLIFGSLVTRRSLWTEFVLVLLHPSIPLQPFFGVEGHGN